MSKSTPDTGRWTAFWTEALRLRQVLHQRREAQQNPTKK